MKIKGTRIPYRLVDGYVEEYGEEFKKELLNDYPYISQEQLDNYLINLYEQNKRYREAIEDIKNVWKVTDTYQEYMDTIHDIINDLEDEEKM